MGLTRAETAISVRENLGDAGVTWYTEENISDSIQDGYNLISALVAPIQKTTFYPLLATPYYHLTDHIPDLFSIQGIYNPITNLWLEYSSTSEMSKWRWDVERWNGQAAFWTPISFRTTMVVPWNPSPTSALYLAYIARAELLSDSSVPNIPQSCKSLLENYATCDLLEQAREFKKSASWLEKVKGNLEDAKLVVKDVARIARLKVMEPWNPLGRYSGQGYNMVIINDEQVTGPINGINTTFQLAQVPNPTSSLALFWNGQLLIQGVAYTLVGNTITMSTDFIPSGGTTGDYLKAWYQLS